MAFFDDKSKKEPQEGVVEKIKLGDEEFDPEELKSKLAFIYNAF